MAKKVPKYVVKQRTFNGLDIYVPEDEKDVMPTLELEKPSDGYERINSSVVDAVKNLKLDD